MALFAIVWERITLITMVRSPSPKHYEVNIQRSVTSSRSQSRKLKSLRWILTSLLTSLAGNSSITDGSDLYKAMRMSRLQWVDLATESSRLICREIFFTKRHYWDILLTLCSALDVPRLGIYTAKKCPFATIPKDLLRTLASMLYPWRFESI